VADLVEDAREGLRNRRWAEEAWEGVRASGTEPYSDDYARGFKSGYADYLDRGGSGEPPVVAPPRYRHLRYQTPQGYLAVEEWFAGYRHGAESARQSGLRQWVTGPTSLRQPGGPGIPGIIVLTPTPPANLGVPVPGASEVLPSPQPVLQPPVAGDELPAPKAAPGVPVSEPGEESLLQKSGALGLPVAAPAEPDAAGTTPPLGVGLGVPQRDKSLPPPSLLGVPVPAPALPKTAAEPAPAGITPPLVGRGGLPRRDEAPNVRLQTPVAAREPVPLPAGVTHSLVVPIPPAPRPDGGD
jgi:hypothetical protein